LQAYTHQKVTLRQVALVLRHTTARRRTMHPGQLSLLSSVIGIGNEVHSTCGLYVSVADKTVIVVNTCYTCAIHNSTGFIHFATSHTKNKKWGHTACNKVLKTAIKLM